MKKRFGVIATIVAAASFFSLITASVAWFEARTDVDFGTGHGSTAASYFESGAGTYDSPFVISNSTHMYNLAWLQYLGQFNTEISPTHFQLKNDIDMSDLGSALPPIGTETYPFIGVFDGKGEDGVNHTIKNLTVSNKIEDLTKRPTSVQSISGCSVVGFFGIVGDPKEIGLNRGDTNLDYDDLDVYEILELQNFNLENVIVKSNAERTLMGVVAGYVNGDEGSVHDIAVKNGSLQAMENAKGLVTKTNRFVSTTDSTKTIISKFSLIGETEDTVWQQVYQQGISPGQGDDSAFGGSMDMKALKQRLFYMWGTDSSLPHSGNGTNTITGQFPSYNAYYGFDSYGVDYSTYETTSAMNIYDNSYLPLNIDKDAMGLNSNNSKYKTGGVETILNTNTGYIVGGGTTSTYNARLATQKYLYPIYRSLNGQHSSDTTITYDRSKLRLATIKWNNGTMQRYQIRDGNNDNNTKFDSKYTAAMFNSNALSLQRYESVIGDLDSLFTATKDSANAKIYYLNLRNRTLSETPTTSELTTASSVSLFGQTKTNYQLPKGCLDFNIKSDGYITCVGYRASSNTLFDLSYVTRGTNNSITSITRINNIYKKSDGSIAYNVASPSSGDTLVVDFSVLKTSIESGYLYYFEIPVSKSIASEYTISNSTSTSLALMYLDVGANGNGSSGGGTTTAKDLKNVRFVHTLAETLANSPTYLDILLEITTAGANGTVMLYFSRVSDTKLRYYQNGGATNVTLRVFVATTDNIEDSNSAVWTS